MTDAVRRPWPPRPWRRVTMALCVAAACASCTLPDPAREGRELGMAGRHAEAVDRLDRAAREQPGSTPVRAELLRQRELRAAQLAEAFAAELRAGRLDDARDALSRLEGFQPEHPRLPSMRAQLATAGRHVAQLQQATSAAAAGRVADARRLARGILLEDSSNVPARRLLADLPTAADPVPARSDAPSALPEAMSRPVTLEFREATLRNVFETLSRTASVNFVFDKDVRSDTRVTVFLRGVSLDEAVRTILQTQALDMRRLNDSTYLVFPNTAAKSRDYVPLEARAFWVSNIDVKQAAQLLRSVVKSRDVFVDERLNMLVVKDTPEAIRLVAQLLATVDIAEPEVVLEVEVLEIANSRLQELGIKFPTQVSYGLPPLSNASGTVAQIITSANRGDQVAQIANPSLVANLRAIDGAVNLLSNPRIRVRNREKARIQVGEKVPVFSTQFAATALGASNAIGASTTYIDVGLKVELEPQVHLENEVAMKVQLEVSNILEQVSGPAGTTAYRIGTRQAQTVLRLADGETQVLAGLIQDNDRVSAQRVPGLGRLPIAGKLFSSELSQVEKTEIVLMITPRIVRDVARGPHSERSLAAGTDTAAGVPPLSLSPQARTGVALSGSGGAPAGRRAPEPPPGAPPAPPVDAAAAAAAPAPEQGGSIELQVPSSARPGQDVSVSVQLAGTGARSAEVDVGYETPAFGIPGPVVTGSGRATVQLSGPEGGALSGSLVLRTSPAGTTTGTVSVLAVRARLPDGTEAPAVALPAPVTVRISQ